jgi:hypothetical protein
MKAVSNTTPLRYLIAIEQEHLLGQLFEKAGGRALIPKNTFRCPILAGFARVGVLSCSFSDFEFLISSFYSLGSWGRFRKSGL